MTFEVGPDPMNVPCKLLYYLVEKLKPFQNQLCFLGPNCHATVMTRTDSETGTKGMIIAAVLCLFG